MSSGFCLMSLFNQLSLQDFLSRLSFMTLTEKITNKSAQQAMFDGQ